MKAIWTGEIVFGMVSIPIDLYSAIKPEEVPTHILHKKCKTRLIYKRWCPKCKVEVPWSKVVKGFEYAKNKFFSLEPEKIKELQPKRTETIDVEKFVNREQIDPIYINSHYYVIPQRAKEKAYFLFKEVLDSASKIAVGKFVLRNKEYICTIENYKNGLLLTTLNYAYEINDITTLEVLKEKPKLLAKEKQMAKQIVKQLSESRLNMERFEETFTDEMKQLIKKKIAGQEIKIEHKPKREKKLMEALRASLR